MIRRLGPSSEINSSSFYSNNTSANLNNSRYHLKRDNKLGGGTQQPSVVKVNPQVMKSIDHTGLYGSHTSNFPHDQNSIRNSSYPQQ